MALDDLLVSTVALHRGRPGVIGGTGTPAATPSATFPANVQANVAATRQMQAQAQRTDGRTIYTVYTDNDALAIKAGDVLVWNGHTLQVLAPARDMGGMGRAFATDCLMLS